jgi:hypothetical protein
MGKNFGESTMRNLAPNSAKEKKFFFKEMSKSVVLTKSSKKDDEANPTTKNKSPSQKITANQSPKKKFVQKKSSTLEDINANSQTNFHGRSKSESKRKCSNNPALNSKRNLIIDTEISVSSKNNTLRSKRELRVEYENKLKKENKEKSLEKRSTSNPQGKISKRKELSYDSLNEDRPKRSVPESVITKKTPNIPTSPNNIQPTSPILNTFPSNIPTDSNNELNSATKSENIQILVDKISSIRLKDLEATKEKERNKKLEKFQHKLAILNEKGKLGFLENDEKTLTSNQNTEEKEVTEENKLDELPQSSPMQTEKIIHESSKEQYKSDDFSESALKSSTTLNARKKISKTGSNNYLNKVIEYSKSVSGRKQKVDSFEYINRIKNNVRNIQPFSENAFRKSSPKEGMDLNNLAYSESLRNSSNLPIKLIPNSQENDKSEENSDNIKNLIINQRKKRKIEQIEKRKLEEKKVLRTYENLRQLQKGIKSKSMSTTKRKHIYKNSSNYLNRAIDNSSILDNDKYLMDIIDFIKDNPMTELNLTKTHFRFNSAKKTSSKRNSFRESSVDKDSNLNSPRKNKNKSVDCSVRQETEVKILNLNTKFSNKDSPHKLLEIATSPKNFEFNSLYNPLSTPEEEKIIEKENKTISHQKFQTFLDEKIRNTVRSINSNDIRSGLGSPNYNEAYQPQFTAPSSNSLVQNSNVSSAKFGNNQAHLNSNSVFPQILETKNSVGEGGPVKMNEYKKKYEDCIERFKNLTENSINSNFSGNVSFKKNLQLGPPENSNFNNLQKSNKNIVPDPEPELLANEVEKVIFLFKLDSSPKDPNFHKKTYKNKANSHRKCEK